MKSIAIVMLIALPGLGACASQPMASPGQDDGVGQAVSQPMRDLSVIREQAPPVLLRAVASPYERADPAGCVEVSREISELDVVLGPDLQPGQKPGQGVSADGLAGDLIEGAVGLPFRGVIRHVTGADQREKALRAAVLAGMVRRGFLKGRLVEMTCEVRTAAEVESVHP